MNYKILPNEGHQQPTLPSKWKLNLLVNPTLKHL